MSHAVVHLVFRQSDPTYPIFAFSCVRIWTLHWNTTTITISALQHYYRSVFRAFAKVLALVPAPTLSSPLVSVFWYIPWCSNGEDDLWKNVLVLTCLYFSGKFSYWRKIGESVCAVVLTCVVGVYPLRCGPDGAVLIPFTVTDKIERWVRLRRAGKHKLDPDGLFLLTQ
ncbi:Hypothetical predicted protein [Prunus dulcis]|uniref:Uncharacterized protein n=1 Tax=Prunus dulcis TaxID=3755 RepID=A0A5E4G108_PRUDU|nr:Hypothetical predicted protein [Prunus dulcis]